MQLTLSIKALVSILVLMGIANAKIVIPYIVTSKYLKSQKPFGINFFVYTEKSTIVTQVSYRHAA